jgi:heme-degrading monooxygenase HmoA
MTFDNDSVDTFLELFYSVDDKIRNFPGCNSLHLYHDLNNPFTIFTHSVWNSAIDLEKYRQSSLFMDTWKKTKVLFSAPAVAWSLEEIVEK